ncbi:MAG: cytidylate kinase-like family protein [Lachnospiraceae bacterium]|nr:cytidylate kinase-like family protein [Lachnospiraceae bacterium]
MRIITISREFGSGGRELGKRVSDILNWAYYDREIITDIAREHGLDEAYVDRILEERPRQTITIRRSFRTLPRQNENALLLGKEKNVIERIAARGNDCIIVGRNADLYLKHENVFSIFVCASMEARIKRCRERADVDEVWSDRDLEKKIRGIDKNRSAIRNLAGGTPWGKSSSYIMTVNTSSWDLRSLSSVIADASLRWFEGRSTI